jgi:hypothetical protein
VNAFGQPEVVARCNAGFQINDPSIRLVAIQHVERNTPDVAMASRTIERPADVFSQVDIPSGIVDASFVQAPIATTCKNLIDAAAEHYVSRKK